MIETRMRIKIGTRIGTTIGKMTKMAIDGEGV